MKTDTHTDAQLRKILKLKRVAVIGMSRDATKAAQHVPCYLYENGYEITPINPSTDQIMGLKSYNSILDVPHDVDIIEIFRPSEKVLSFVQEAVQKKPKVIWLQEGIYDKKSEQLAAESGIDMVFNRCMLVEHMRLNPKGD